jgi:hypothetical protein
MRRSVRITTAAVFSILAMVTIAAQAASPRVSAASQHHVVVPADAVKWEPLTEGAELAVLAGEPFNLTKVGVPFVFRVKHKDGFALKPHWHPMDEYITVLSGTMLLGAGNEFQTDATHVQELSAGGYAFMPGRMRHYFVTRGETIVQFQGVGPFRMTFVNAADDPRPPAERH